MTALGKLFRTTTFKLTLVYLTVFALFAAFLLGYFALNTRRLITEQITDTVNAEITGLSEQYRQGGIRRLVIVVDARARRPGSSLYLVTTFTGEALAGNVTALQPGILDNPGWTETVYRRLDEAEGREHFEHQALVRVFQLPGGFRLLVGRDLDERERLYHIVLAAGRWSIAIVIVLGLAGGLFVTRRVLRRVDAMTETTRTIMGGDLGGRLPVAGTGDELDRLAENLNVMLERIEALMRGLKEVSDNIAHDLKTPLTRLRNRCEQALRTSSSEAEYRAALEATIEESDESDRDLQRAVDDRARGIRPGARRHEGVRCRRDRARRLRAVRAAGRGEGHRAQGGGRHGGAGQRQPRTGEPGARQSGRQRHQICRAASTKPANGVAPEIVVRALNEGDRILLTVADQRAGHSGSRPLARGRALRAARAEPFAAGLRAGLEPGRGGGAAAWRRIDAGG